MNRNMPKLDKDKSELIVFSSNHNVEKTENLCIKVESMYITYVMSVINLGLKLALRMDKQVNI